MCADKRVGGSRGKLYRCDGAVLDIKSKAKETIVRACRQSSTQEWRSLTNVRYALGVPRMQVRALRAEAAKFINSNANMTASSLKNS